jgi:drug/metabolite transporter (DMT)-like permease
MDKLTVVALAAACAVLTTAGQIALKTGVSDPGLANLLGSAGPGAFLVRALLTPLVITGLILYVASTGLWLVILARADISFAFPLVSMGFVLTVGYAHFVLNEQVSITRLAGVALIMIGVVFISRS